MMRMNVAGQVICHDPQCIQRSRGGQRIGYIAYMEFDLGALIFHRYVNKFTMSPEGPRVT